MLRLRNGSSSELQKSSTEVLAVGLCIALARELFDIRLNRISVIETSGKRCDFTFEKADRRYVLESKGRESDSQIVPAIRDVFVKKSASPAPSKYGVVSHLPRDGTPISAIVVDPDDEEAIPTREDSISRLLGYYAKASRLAGFWRLAELLSVRSTAIDQRRDLEGLERVALDYQNVFKVGKGYTLTSNNFSIEIFFPADKTLGFRQEIDDRIIFYSLDKSLVEILEKQDFDALLQYRPAIAITDIIETNLGMFSVNDDGTVFGFVSRELFESA
jgi:hypothetical protein